MILATDTYYGPGGARTAGVLFRGWRDDAPDATVAVDPVDKMDFLSDRDTIEMMELYRKLPQTQRSAVLAFMRSMAVESKTGNLSVAK